jgi:tetratricopeptide (TPR) repeat protein
MRRFALVPAILLMSACSSAPGPKAMEPSPSHPTSSAPQSAPPAGGPSAGSAEASNNAPNTALDDKVAELRAAYDKNPADPKAKKDLEAATLQNANYYMYKSNLSPGQKYPKALSLYRQVLKLDPANSEAQEAVGMIESIYRQLGKPVPEV